jgi:hypothetical protein
MPSDHVRAALRKKFAQNGAVAAALVFAVATQRKICHARQGRQHRVGAAPVTIDRNAKDVKLPDQLAWQESPGSPRLLSLNMVILLASESSPESPAQHRE